MPTIEQFNELRSIVSTKAKADGVATSEQFRDLQAMLGTKAKADSVPSNEH